MFKKILLLNDILSKQRDFPRGSVVKNLLADAEDTGLMPGSGSFPGEGNGNQLLVFLPGNPMDRGVWQATVCGVPKSQTQLSD